jgi:PAS domain-containing protein
VQDTLNSNIFYLIILATSVFIIFIVGYLWLIIASNKKNIENQNKIIEEVTKSEQRYKALFDNSLAGIMKFDFKSWDVLEANQSILEMFNCKDIGSLQKTFNSLPLEKLQFIQTMLNTKGLVEECDLEFKRSSKVKRELMFSARREGDNTTAYAVVLFETAKRLVG